MRHREVWTSSAIPPLTTQAPGSADESLATTRSKTTRSTEPIERDAVSRSIAGAGDARARARALSVSRRSFAFRPAERPLDARGDPRIDCLSVVPEVPEGEHPALLRFVDRTVQLRGIDPGRRVDVDDRPDD